MDLRIINAFAAEIPLRTIPALARSKDVHWVSLDGPVVTTDKPPKDPDPVVDYPPTYYLDTVDVQQVRELGYRGEGITVAVIDSGIAKGPDFEDDPTLKENHQTTRILTQLAFNHLLTANDNNGHGSHVAGIIGGNGANSGGVYTGIAPKVNLLSLNVSNYDGMAYESDTIAAIQWVLDNKDLYNIRVVNMSFNGTIQQSNHTSPMDAAAEILWFDGIVVVASAGNSGTEQEYNPVDKLG